MSKTLVLAEKPSVGRELARVLGCGQKREGYFEGKDYCVTWALGHLVTLAEPEAYGKEYEKWDLATLPMLPKKMQLNIIKRIAVLESVSPEIVRNVEDVLEKRFSAVVSVDMTEIGGINYVADIMNHTDRTTEKFIFDELGKSDPSLSNEIRKLMFVFEDIVHLDDMTIQRILRDVDQQDLAIAIKGSSEEIKNVLLNNVSSRAKENLLSDIEYLRNVRMKDVEAAQQKIVDTIRVLEEGGEIVISRGEEDMIIA